MLDIDERVDEAIRKSARTETLDERSLLLLLRASVDQAKRKGQRRRKAWLAAPTAVLLTLTGGLALTGALPALADNLQHFAAESGIFGDGLGSGGSDSGRHYTEQDSSQWIKLNAKDFSTYAAGQMPSYVTLPTGMSRPRFAKDVAAMLSSGLTTKHDSVMQTTGLKHAFEIGARCSWYHAWKTADIAGQSSFAAADSQQFLASISWRETVATDEGGVVESLKSIYAAGSAHDWNAADATRGVDCDQTYMKQITK